MAKARNPKVFLTDRAIDDLRQIESYSVSRWGHDQAAKYLDAFDRFFRLVESQPGILLPIPIIDSLLAHHVESHMVVCVKWHDDILVLTIVHASRDVVNHLDRLLPTLKSEVDTMIRRLP
jgi:plasmid stabilization system protein ParE